MSEVSKSATGIGDGKSGTSKTKRTLRLVAWLCAAVAIGFVAKSYMDLRSATAEKAASGNVTVRSTGLIETITPKHLAGQFTDVSGRLLADPPSSADQLLDPSTIVVGHWVDTDSETPNISWDQFEKRLAEITGRKVQDLKFDNSPAQIEQIKKGEITIVALHAADAPFLVNNCGYQPAAVLAEDAGGVSGNHLDIIVPANSTINNLSDLRGHTLACVVPSSVTGYRAAITLLNQTEGLRPDVDYYLSWTLKQKTSIEGIAQNKYQAAAVSDDKLQSLLQSGDVQASQYRQLYQSKVIPRITIGWFYNLKPELAAQIRDAILSFRPDAAPGTQPATGDIAPDASSQALHFVPVDYKKDFELVRLIDDSFDPRLDSKAVKTN